jgi:hypothetical protein
VFIGFLPNYNSVDLIGYSQVFWRGGWQVSGSTLFWTADSPPTVLGGTAGAFQTLLRERLEINSIADIVGWRFRIPNTPENFTRFSWGPGVTVVDPTDIKIDSTLFTINNFVLQRVTGDLTVVRPEDEVYLNFSPMLWDPTAGGFFLMCNCNQRPECEKKRNRHFASV